MLIFFVVLDIGLDLDIGLPRSHNSLAIMFQPSQPLFKALRRLPMTTKQAPKKGGYYKGNRTGSMGWHTKFGNYRIDWRKVRTYVVPQGLNDVKVSVVFFFWQLA
jgi:hypothetical protein